MIEEEGARLDRLNKIEKDNVNPYPSKATRSHYNSEFLDNFDEIKSKEDTVNLVGRIKTIRKHGGLTFLHLDDGSAKVQLAIKKDNVGEKIYKSFHETMDIGDFIEVTGTAFVTKKGENSLDINEYKILTKTLLPLPEKWHGLQDVETRFRKRYLDLIMNSDVRDRFKIRTKMISAMRDFFDQKNFIEVETPTLQPIYGGGYAKPFKTHHNAMNADFYLRISDEMYLKRLLVGGFDRVYEITKVFRNEGIDKDHNPEFTLCEAQIAYKDYEWGMDTFEEIIEHVAKKATGSTTIKHGENQLEFKRPWKRMRLIETIEEIAGIPASSWDDFHTAKTALEKNVPKEKKEDIDRIKTTGEAMALAFEELVEEKLIQPTIIYDYPVEVSPLAKKSKDSRFTERFEVFTLGMEIGNNYSELNNPIDLEERFVEEKKKEEAGFDEAHQTDWDYIEAIKHGMPPACGLGFGIDRIVMAMTDAKNIKEVILFPTLKINSESRN